MASCFIGGDMTFRVVVVAAVVVDDDDDDDGRVGVTTFAMISL